MRSFRSHVQYPEATAGTVTLYVAVSLNKELYSHCPVVLMGTWYCKWWKLCGRKLLQFLRIFYKPWKFSLLILFWVPIYMQNVVFILVKSKTVKVFPTIYHWTMKLLPCITFIIYGISWRNKCQSGQHTLLR